MFERAFGVDPKTLERDDRFLEALRTEGLALRVGQRWDGLVKKETKKAFAPRDKNKKKKKKGR